MAYFGSDLLLAVGRQSSDFSRLSNPEAINFEAMEGKFHTVATNRAGEGSVAFASGAEGKIAKLILS